MGRKPKERKYVKPTDGRKHNGRKRGEKINKVMVTPTHNKAQKDRVHIYALNAMKEVFGSEEKAWASLLRRLRIHSHTLNYCLNINMVNLKM